MAEPGHKIVYLLVEKGANENKRTYWRSLGAAYLCRDGSLNVKLDIHPGLTFNIRSPKSNGERAEIEPDENDYGHEPTEASGASETIRNTATNDGNDFNDAVFKCEDCLKTVSNDEAHALYAGGAVCNECGGKYRSCARCDYFFLRGLPGKVCPKCRGER